MIYGRYKILFKVTLRMWYSGITVNKELFECAKSKSYAQSYWNDV